MSSVISTRQVGSVIVDQSNLNGNATNIVMGPDGRPERVRYVEVPVVEDVVREVPRLEIVEVERRVPEVQVQYVDKVVEVPEIRYRDTVVEIPDTRERVVYVPKKEYVEVPKEVIQHVPEIHRKKVTQVVDVPGELIERPRVQRVMKEVAEPRYVANDHVQGVVSQSLYPRIGLTSDPYEVPDPMKIARPDLVEVEIKVPRVVDVPLVSYGITSDQHRILTDVPLPHRSRFIRQVNPNVAEEDLVRGFGGAYVPGMEAYGPMQSYNGPVVNPIINPPLPYNAPDLPQYSETPAPRTPYDQWTPQPYVGGGAPPQGAPPYTLMPASTNPYTPANISKLMAFNTAYPKASSLTYRAPPALYPQPLRPGGGPPNAFQSIYMQSDFVDRSAARPGVIGFPAYHSAYLTSEPHILIHRNPPALHHARGGGNGGHKQSKRSGHR